MTIDFGVLARYARILRPIEVAYDLEEEQVTAEVVAYVIGSVTGTKRELRDLSETELRSFENALHRRAQPSSSERVG